MARLLWLPQAKRDIQRLYTFLEQKTPKAAVAAIRAIRSGADKLREHPRLGRIMDDETGRRELVTPFGGRGYVLRYVLDGDDVIIIRVWHTQELSPR